MPALVEIPVPGFTLSDFTNIPNPPADQTPKGNDAPVVTPTVTAPGAATIPEPEIKPLVEPDADKKGADAPEPDPDDPEPNTSLEQAMRKKPDTTKPKDEPDTTAADKKAADDAAAAEKAKADAIKAPERDADIKPQLGEHVHPKTRKIISEIQAKAKAARDERDTIIAESEVIKKERDELVAKAKQGPAVTVPKEVDDELKTLRERLRALDIEKDPAIEAKYDRKIASNNDSIISVLKAQGYGMVKKDGTDEMVENPKAIAELVKGGLTLKNLHPLIAKLDAAGLIEEAEAIRERLRENGRISSDRQQEIEIWKGNYDQRVAQRNTATKEQQDRQSVAFREKTESFLKADIDELAKDFSFIKEPAAALPTDAPAVHKAKQTAIDEFRAAEAKIQEAVKAFNPQGVAPEKLSEVVGRINAAAIKSQVITLHILPRLKQELAAANARIKEQEAELGKIRGAGKLSRLQGSGPDTPPNNGESTATDLAEAFKMAGPRA